MKINSEINLVQDAYRVQIDTVEFTSFEYDQMLAFGEPQIDIGGSFSEAITRPGQTNTTVVITHGTTGTGATAVAVIGANNTILGVTVTAGGSGYDSATVAFVGDGTGATATATVVGGVVTAIVVTAPGTNYHAVPYTTNFTLPSALRRISTDFPIVQVFDFGDYADADARAKTYNDTIVNRLTTAKSALVTQTTNFQGETLVTV